MIKNKNDVGVGASKWDQSNKERQR